MQTTPPVTSVELPPGLDSMLTMTLDEPLPEPKIAYDDLPDLPNIGLPPGLATAGLQPKTNKKQLSEGDGPGAAAGAGGERSPLVRFCVFCGMKVAPKLINARFCVYCGSVHSGQTSATDAVSRQQAPPPLSYSMDYLGWNGLSQRPASLPMGTYSDAMAWQELADSFTMGQSEAYGNPAYWQGQNFAAMYSMAAYEAAMPWQGTPSDNDDLELEESEHES